MPKSKVRKGRKKYLSKAPAGPVHQAPKRFKVAKNTVPGRKLSATDDHADLLFQVVLIMPLAFSAWIAGGLAVPNALSFALVLAVVVGAHYLQLLFSQKLQLARMERFVMALWAIIGIAVVLFFLESRSMLISAALLFWILLRLLPLQLSQTTSRAVFLRMFAVCFHMMTLSVIGAYTQSREIFLPVALLGFVPGCYLAAAIVARYAGVLEAAGWKRSTMVEKKDSDILRPGGLSRMFSILLILGPIIPIGLAPLGYLPETLLITALPLYYMPGIAGSFFERLAPDEQISVRTVKIGALSGLLAFLGVLLSRF